MKYAIFTTHQSTWHLCSRCLMSYQACSIYALISYIMLVWLVGRLPSAVFETLTIMSWMILMPGSK